MKRMMKALVFPSSWRVEVVETEVPTPGPNQILAEIRCVGICGSDVGIYEGDHWIVAHGPGGHGHETGAVAIEVGRDVEGIQPGDHLARMGAGYAQYSKEVNVVGHGKDEKLGWMSQKEYATRMGYGIGYKPVLEDAEVQDFIRGWMGEESMNVYLDTHREATNLREVAPAMASTWFPEWQMKAQSVMQNALNGQITADEAAEGMIDLVEEFKAGN